VSSLGNFSARDLISADGQIILALAAGPLRASELYKFVRASQPTVSRRLGFLISKNVLSMKQTPDDRRCCIYSLNPLSMWQGFAEQDIELFGQLACTIKNKFLPVADGNSCCSTDS